MVEMCTLGTGGTLPLPNRGLSSLYIRVNGQAMLIDCGEGTQVGVRRLGWGFRCVDGIALTHFHGDHCTGLAGMLLSMEKAGRDTPFVIYGPLGLRKVVEGLCVIVPRLSFPVMLEEYDREGLDFEMIGLKIHAFPVDHGIPCYGFRMELERAPVFDPEKAKALGVPVTEWKKLQAGDSVRVGLHRIRPEQVRGPARKGIQFVYCTDTRPCENIRKAGQDTDLMVLEGMYGEEEKMPQALKNHHMLFREAAELAKEACTGNLVLTHFSTSLDDPESALPAAQAVFPNTLAARDGMKITLNYPTGREKAPMKTEILPGWMV